MQVWWDRKHRRFWLRCKRSTDFNTALATHVCMNSTWLYFSPNKKTVVDLYLLIYRYTFYDSVGMPNSNKENQNILRWLKLLKLFVFELKIAFSFSICFDLKSFRMRDNRTSHFTITKIRNVAVVDNLFFIRCFIQYTFRILP